MPLSKIVAKSITDDTITTDQIADTSVHGQRNLIINGAMQVAQRATSVTSQTSNNVYHTVDRFVAEVSGATYDMSQSTTVPSGQGFSYSLKTVLDGAFTPSAAQYFVPFEQRIEGQNLQHLAYGTSDAKSVTLSFWIRSSKTGTYVVEFSNFNSTQSRKYSKQYTINAADTWEYKTLTWEGDTVSSFDNNNGLEGAFYWWITAGTNFTSGTIPSGWENSTTANRAVGVPTSLADNDEYYLTGVQLEVGEQATPFEHRSFHDEVMSCQRYYAQSGGPAEPFASGNYSYQGDMASHGSSNGWHGAVFLPTTMRDNPTMTAGTTQAYNGSSWTTWNTVSLGARRTNSFFYDLAGTVSTSNGQSLLFRSDWKADAEL